MRTQAVVLNAPESLALATLALHDMMADDLTVDIAFSGISTGTERLLWSGRMPAFPGMGYPLVPGYESVGTVVAAGDAAQHRIGETVFVPGANCYHGARGLFGGSAARVVLPSARAVTVAESLNERAVLVALAATARHALAGGTALPELIVGHGVLGRLLARLVIAMGGDAPVIWETDARRRAGDTGYAVVDPRDDDRRDYGVILDASGAGDLLDTLIARLARGGEIVLAGFYEAPMRFAFPPAFMREARLRVAAEWTPEDLGAVLALVEAGLLSLDGLITHCRPAGAAEAAYRQAFGDADCLKMLLDWRGCA
ncbi:chlorophyll synthesis pathway protein BchC [Sandaracinobacteroides saxicola]|uniref:Chlorophyll synthesis pathway protein BchC n=1 Tax=Sandaracinobacteroides saxicola TaxID=2759707 RepID=A0A7G5IKS7_9SPHN|nr:chlorophyll synthesis pathway protein BchC [Sandaracinobacteroides saxicola]QMW23969.1 chlorophyll synthesis pathway protein BchC [Sandaracinobacteroides saxicola]